MTKLREFWNGFLEILFVLLYKGLLVVGFVTWALTLIFMFMEPGPGLLQYGPKAPFIAAAISAMITTVCGMAVLIIRRWNPYISYGVVGQK